MDAGTVLGFIILSLNGVVVLPAALLFYSNRDVYPVKGRESSGVIALVFIQSLILLRITIRLIFPTLLPCLLVYWIDNFLILLTICIYCLRFCRLHFQYQITDAILVAQGRQQESESNPSSNNTQRMLQAHQTELSQTEYSVEFSFSTEIAKTNKHSSKSSKSVVDSKSSGSLPSPTGASASLMNYSGSATISQAHLKNSFEEGLKTSPSLNSMFQPVAPPTMLLNNNRSSFIVPQPNYDNNTPKSGIFRLPNESSSSTISSGGTSIIKLNLNKKKPRPSKSPSIRRLQTADSAWYVNHRHWTYPNVQVRIAILACLIYLIVPLILTVRASQEDRVSTDSCGRNSTFLIGMSCLLCMVLVHLIFLGWLWWSTRSRNDDHFYLRKELIFTASFYVAALLGFFICSITYPDRFILSVFLTLATLSTVCGASVYPWYLSYTHRFNSRRSRINLNLKRSAHVDANVEIYGIPLDELLESEEGFELFLDFLRSEFSSENLLFWRDVRQFYALGTVRSDRENIRRAQYIFTKYVEHGAPFQINLPATLYRVIKSNVESYKNKGKEKHQSCVVRDVFKEGEEEIFRLMNEDSYVRFRETREYLNLLKHRLPQSSQELEMSRAEVAESTLELMTPTPRGLRKSIQEVFAPHRERHHSQSGTITSVSGENRDWKTDEELPVHFDSTLFQPGGPLHNLTNLPSTPGMDHRTSPNPHPHNNPGSRRTSLSTTSGHLSPPTSHPGSRRGSLSRKGTALRPLISPGTLITTGPLSCLDEDHTLSQQQSSRNNNINTPQDDFSSYPLQHHSSISNSNSVSFSNFGNNKLIHTRSFDRFPKSGSLDRFPKSDSIQSLNYYTEFKNNFHSTTPPHTARRLSSGCTFRDRDRSPTPPPELEQVVIPSNDLSPDDKPSPSMRMESAGSASPSPPFPSQQPRRLMPDLPALVSTTLDDSDQDSMIGYGTLSFPKSRSFTYPDPPQTMTITISSPKSSLPVSSQYQSSLDNSPLTGTVSSTATTTENSPPQSHSTISNSDILSSHNDNRTSDNSRRSSRRSSRRNSRHNLVIDSELSTSPIFNLNKKRDLQLVRTSSELMEFYVT